MPDKAFQDYYAENMSHCYGCGRLNEDGLHVRSFWEGDQTVCTFQPRPYHKALPGFVYGGLIASVIDCHSTGSAAAAAFRREGRPMDSDPPVRFVTASLHIDYLRPTPIAGPLHLRSRFKEVGERKVIVLTDLLVDGQVCARGEVLAVRLQKVPEPPAQPPPAA